MCFADGADSAIAVGCSGVRFETTEYGQSIALTNVATVTPMENAANVPIQRLRLGTTTVAETGVTVSGLTIDCEFDLRDMTNPKECALFKSLAHGEADTSVPHDGDS